MAYFSTWWCYGDEKLENSIQFGKKRHQGTNYEKNRGTYFGLGYITTVLQLDKAYPTTHFVVSSLCVGSGFGYLQNLLNERFGDLINFLWYLLIPCSNTWKILYVLPSFCCEQQTEQRIEGVRHNMLDHVPRYEAHRWIQSSDSKPWEAQNFRRLIEDSLQPVSAPPVSEPILPHT